MKIPSPCHQLRGARLSSRHIRGGRHRPETIRGLATDPQAMRNAASLIVAEALRGGYSGLVLDFAGMTARDLDALLAVSGTITDSAHAHEYPARGNRGSRRGHVRRIRVRLLASVSDLLSGSVV